MKWWLESAEILTQFFYIFSTGSQKDVFDRKQSDIIKEVDASLRHLQSFLEWEPEAPLVKERVQLAPVILSHMKIHASGPPSGGTTGATAKKRKPPQKPNSARAIASPRIAGTSQSHRDPTDDLAIDFGKLYQYLMWYTSTEAAVHVAVTRFDEDRDGYLNDQEIARLLQVMGAPANVIAAAEGEPPPPVVSQAVALMDYDGDGRVSRGDAFLWMLNLRPLYQVLSDPAADESALRIENLQAELKRSNVMMKRKDAELEKLRMRVKELEESDLDRLVAENQRMRTVITSWRADHQREIETIKAEAQAGLKNLGEKMAQVQESQRLAKFKELAANEALRLARLDRSKISKRLLKESRRRQRVEENLKHQTRLANAEKYRVQTLEEELATKKQPVMKGISEETVHELLSDLRGSDGEVSGAEGDKVVENGGDDAADIEGDKLADSNSNMPSQVVAEPTAVTDYGKSVFLTMYSGYPLDNLDYPGTSVPEETKQSPASFRPLFEGLKSVSLHGTECRGLFSRLIKMERLLSERYEEKGREYIRAISLHVSETAESEYKFLSNDAMDAEERSEAWSKILSNILSEELETIDTALNETATRPHEKFPMLLVERLESLTPLD
eukprot:Rmarinus@m.19135